MQAGCRQCGSERIAPDVRVAAAGTGGLLGRLRASVCADCGFTELRTDDPVDLYVAHMRKAEGTASPLPANIQCPSCGSVLAAAANACEVCGWTQDTPAS